MPCVDPFALEFKLYFPTEITTQKMVRFPGTSSNLFNAYLVEPQKFLILKVILNQFEELIGNIAILLEKAYAIL